MVSYQQIRPQALLQNSMAAIHGSPQMCPPSFPAGRPVSASAGSQMPSRAMPQLTLVTLASFTPRSLPILTLLSQFQPLSSMLSLSASTRRIKASQLIYILADVVSLDPEQLFLCQSSECLQNSGLASNYFTKWLNAYMAGTWMFPHAHGGLLAH